MMNTKRLMSLFSFTTLVLGSIALNTSVVRADTDGESDDTIKITPVAVSAGAGFSNGDHKGVLITLQVAALSGKIETRQVLLTSDALVRIRQSMGTGQLDEASSRLLSVFKNTELVGRSNIGIKGVHIGLGTKGITVGKDKDAGFSEYFAADIFAIASYVLGNIEDDSGNYTRMDTHFGYTRENLTTTAGVEAKRDNLYIEESLHLGSPSESYEATVSVYAGVDAANEFATRFGAAVTGNARVVSVGPAELGLSLEGKIEKDEFRKTLGLKEWDGRGMLSVNIVPVTQESIADLIDSASE